MVKLETAMNKVKNEPTTKAPDSKPVLEGRPFDAPILSFL